MYSIYVSTPNVGLSESNENSNHSLQTIGSSANGTSTNVRGLDLINFPRAREVFRVTPPPPYEIQMLEMSRGLQPATSRPSELSARETEIIQEAQKMIQRLYEEMKRTGQLEPQTSEEEQPVQQVLQTFKTPMRQQQSRSSKVSHQNLVVQKQQSVAKSSPGRGIPQSSINDQPMKKVAQEPKTPERQQQTISLKLSHQNLVVQKQQSVAETSFSSGKPQSSINEKPMKKVLETPKALKRKRQTISPKISYQNLVVQKQQAVAKSRPNSGILPVGLHTNQQKVPQSSFATELDLGRLLIGSERCSSVNPPVKVHTNQQKVPQSSLPIELDLERLLIGSERCNVINPQQSSHVPCHPPDVDFGTNQALQQKVTPNSAPTQPDLKKYVITNDGYIASPPQMSPRRQSALMADKRKPTSPKTQQPARPNTKGNVIRMASIVNLSQNNEYEEIEVVENIQSENSSQRLYDSVESFCTENEIENYSEQSSSVASGTSEHSLEQREISCLPPNVIEPHQLSIQASRKFCKLGVSPQTVLNAIVECPELDGDEWMAAWNLYLQNFPPAERARILGLRLQEAGVSEC